jgi:hypothetical protein
MINKQIYITSLGKAVYNAKITGKLNTKIIQVFNLYKYYIDFSENLSNLGSTQFEETIINFKKQASNLVYKYPSLICNYKTIIPDDTSRPNGTLQPPNYAPTVSDNSVNIETNTTYQFKVSDFILDFEDINFDGYKYLLIYPLSSSLYGNLKTNNNTTELTSSIILNIEGLSSSTNIDLYYNRTDFSAFGPDNFNFRISDNNINHLYSSIHTISVSGTISNENNLPPEDIGDITIYVDNRVSTTLTLAMFTTGLIAPYNDPEGDLIDAIRIIDISNANQGIFYLNGAPIIEGQIILREDIENELFTHIGPNTDSINSDVFEFEARDEGSLIWIS